MVTDYDPLPPADVLLISYEDDAADTIVPRLLVDGADMRRIHLVDGVPSHSGFGGWRQGFAVLPS